MPKITAIKPQKRLGRYNIFLDGKFALGLDENNLAASGLRLGQEIDEVALQELKQKGFEGKLLDKALRFLSFRPRSEHEVREYLTKKIPKAEFPTDKSTVEADSVVIKLKEMGLLADRSFALWWLEQRQSQGQPYGRRRISLELQQKGIERAVIDELTSGLGAASELVPARKAALKKVRLYSGLPERERRAKLTAYLMRRGFGWPTIKELLKEPDFH